MHCPAGGETVNFYFVECGFHRLFRSFFVIEPFNRRKWFVIHASPKYRDNNDNRTTHSWRIHVFLFYDNRDNTSVACMSHGVCFRLHSKKLDFILRFDFVFFLLAWQ